MGTIAQIFSSEAPTMRSQVEEKTGEEVLAVGQLRQGRTPSMAAMITGTALFGLMRPRRSKALPRGFALAVTPSRVVAFSCIGVADDEYGENYHVVVRGEERGSWPREAVSLEPTESEKDFTLLLGGERLPVCRPNTVEDPETDELVELLA